MEALIQLAIALVGLILGFLLRILWVHLAERHSSNQAAAILEEAQQEAQRILREADLIARDEALRKKEVFEQEINTLWEELREAERNFHRREENLERKSHQLSEQEEKLAAAEEQLALQQEQLAEEKTRLQALIEAESKVLREISSLSREQAISVLFQRLREEVEEEVSLFIEKEMKKAREEAEQKTRDLVLAAIQRCAVEHTADNVVSTIGIPSEEMKGRIIGREGRNIRSFEKATGIDVIVDDTPGVVVVSGFDPIRREIASRSMQKLILDGRIHPARIEEVVEHTRQEVREIIQETGKQAAYSMDIHDLHPELIALLGHLQYRSCNGQNLLQHTLEVAQLCALMASELNLDVALAKRCGLLHDLGYAADLTMEGNHAQIGSDLARRCGEKDLVVNAIIAHHGQVPSASAYAILVQAAQGISEIRPGARKEVLGHHLKRLERMEKIALSFPAVEQAYAIQAGRELRCLVNANLIEDHRMIRLARDIAKKIEEELTYPTEIKVAIIRETRVVEYAK